MRNAKQGPLPFSAIFYDKAILLKAQCTRRTVALSRLGDIYCVLQEVCIQLGPFLVPFCSIWLPPSTTGETTQVDGDLGRSNVLSF